MRGEDEVESRLPKAIVEAPGAAPAAMAFCASRAGVRIFARGAFRCGTSTRGCGGFSTLPGGFVLIHRMGTVLAHRRVPCRNGFGCRAQTFGKRRSGTLTITPGIARDVPGLLAIAGGLSGRGSFAGAKG
jgi:hypothetical protein